VRSTVTPDPGPALGPATVYPGPAGAYPAAGGVPELVPYVVWPCDPLLLQARLPVGLAIETFQRTAWVGLTPFHLMGLRPPFLPAISCVSDLPKMNLRIHARGRTAPASGFFPRCRGRDGGAGGAPDLWPAVPLVAHDSPRHRKTPDTSHECQDWSGGGHHG
jgi:hypothetical protein